MKIEYILAQIAIGGVLVGDRTFKFEGKSTCFLIQCTLMTGRTGILPQWSLDPLKMDFSAPVLSLKIIFMGLYIKWLLSLKSSSNKVLLSYTLRKSTLFAKLPLLMVFGTAMSGWIMKKLWTLWLTYPIFSSTRIIQYPLIQDIGKIEGSWSKGILKKLKRKSRKWNKFKEMIES